MKIQFRNMAAWAYSWWLHARGDFKKIHKLSAAGRIIHSVYFHNPSKRLFEKSVQWFLKRGYRFISKDELFTILSTGVTFPPQSVIFTVDDGWRENFTNVYPIAEKYQIPVTIFITSQPVQTGERYWWSAVEHALDKDRAGYKLFHLLKALPDNERRLKVEEICSGVNQQREAMTIEELQMIAASPYIDIGGHSLTHPILTKCSDEKLKEEIVSSTMTLRQWTKKEIVDFAYPNGSYDQRVIEELKKSGYRMAFTTKPEFIYQDNIPDIYAIPRFDVLEDVSFRENVCRMSGVWFLHKKKDKVNSWE